MWSLLYVPPWTSMYKEFKMYQKQSQLPPSRTPLPFVGILLQIDFRHLSKSYQKVRHTHTQFPGILSLFPMFILDHTIVCWCGVLLGFLFLLN